MDMNYDILSYDELPADEAAMLKADAEEAERGYTDEQLSEALKRTPGRPLAVAAPLPQRDPRPSGRRTRREAGTVHAQTPHEPQQCGAHAPRQGAGRDLILRPKAGPPSRGGGPAVFSDLRYTADVRVSRRPAHEVAAARRWARRPQPDPSSTSPDQALRGDANLIANRAPCR